MPFLVGVVGVTDSSGNRVDTPDENGDHSPLILQLGASMIGTKSTTEGGLTKVVVESAAAGSSAPGVASVAVLKAIAHASLTDKQTRPTADLNVGWRWDATALANVASSDILSAKPDDLSAGLAGRHVRLSDMPTVQTFAQMIGLVEGTHSRVHLAEYWIGTGIGGGIFTRLTTTAPNSDGGSIVKIGTTEWWRREGQGALHSEDFGVLADGANATFSVTASSSTIVASVAPAVPFVIGQVVLFQAGNTPSNGTAATVGASTATGTWASRVRSNLLIGNGSTDTTEFFVGMLIRNTTAFGAGVDVRVTEIVDAHNIRVSQFAVASAGPLTLTRYYVQGTSSLFLTELREGQAVYVGADLGVVVGVGSDTKVGVYFAGGFPSNASGLRVYRQVSIAGVITGLNSTTSIVLGSMSGTVATTSSGHAGIYGTNNTTTGNAFVAACIAQQRAGEWQGGAPIMFGPGGLAHLDQSTSQKGLTLRGQGRFTLNGGPGPGDPTWISVGASRTTTLLFTQTDGFVAKGTFFYFNLTLMNVIGSGSGVFSGYGLGENVGAGDGFQYSQVDKVLFANWGDSGFTAVNSQTGTHGDVQAFGCTKGFWFTGGGITDQSFGKVHANSCGVGLLISGGEGVYFHDHLTQGNIRAGTLFRANVGEQIGTYQIDGGWFEDSIGCCSQLGFEAINGLIRNVVISKGKSSNAGVVDPVVVGAGDIHNIFTLGCYFKSMVVRPKFRQWKDSSEWNGVDMTGCADAQSGIDRDMIGGASNGYPDVLGPTKFPWSPAVITPVANVATPDLVDGAMQYVTATANLTIANLVVNGQVFNPPQFWEFELRVLNSGGAWKHTFGSMYLLNQVSAPPSGRWVVYQFFYDSGTGKLIQREPPPSGAITSAEPSTFWQQRNADGTYTKIVGTTADKSVQVGDDSGAFTSVNVGPGGTVDRRVNGVRVAYDSATQSVSTTSFVCTKGNVGTNASHLAGLNLFNGTAAALGAPQYSTEVQWNGAVWTTASGGSSLTVTWGAGVRSIEAGTSPYHQWFLFGQTNFGSATDRFILDSRGNVHLNPSGSVVATNAADGFTYVPICQGTPTGTPTTTTTGEAPMLIDTIGSKLWVYIGGAWKSAALT